MGALQEFRRIIKSNTTFQNRQALEDNKLKAQELLEQKKAFLDKLQEMKSAKKKNDTCTTTYHNLNCFETYLILKDGIFAGIKNTEDGKFYFEFAFPKNKTKTKFNYYFTTEMDNNTLERPNFNINHIIDEDGKCYYATTFVRTAVVTAPLQATTEIIAAGTDKTLDINFDEIHKSLPLATIKDLIVGDTNLKQKAVTDQQLFQVQKLKIGLDIKK